MIPILTDPWVIGISLHASNAETLAKVHALNQVCVVLGRLYPLEILPFIDLETYSQFQIMINNYKGSDRQSLRRFIHHFVMNNELNNGLPEITKPCPDDLPESWLKVLAAKGNTDEPPHWRSPMVLVPEIRRPEWPAGDEIKYTVNELHRKRNLVVIESYADHAHFEPDIDPWRLGCVGEPRPDAPVDERPTTCKRLPRPPQLRKTLPLSQLTVEARKISNSSCGMDNHYFYLPPVSWQPTERGRDNWRNNSFECDGVVLKERGKTESGYVDRNGHIWVWDKGEKDHWDVKTADDIRIARVSYSGLKKRS